MSTKTSRKPRPSKKAETNGKAPMPDVEILTLAEAAKFLRVSEDGLKTDAISGKVPGRLVAGEWRFWRAALLNWLGHSEPRQPSVKLTGKELVDHIRKTGVPWNADSNLDAEMFIKMAKATSLGE